MSATKTKTRTTRGSPSPAKALRPTLGPVVCRWIERNLVHAEGDYYGQAIHLRPWQRALLYEMYELLPDGRRIYDRVLIGLPKGNGKTELAAMVACAELAGPVTFGSWSRDGKPQGQARVSPDIPVAAASFDQANLVFGACRVMMSEGRLAEECEVFETDILLKGRPGRLYRVAAVAGTNDGGKPTFWVGDELHEWVDAKERVHLVLSNNRAKRKDAWELGITTAGWNTESLLGKMCGHGKRCREGEVSDPRFLFRWYEADLKWDLSKPEELEAAIREANPAAGDFLPLESVTARFAQTPEFEARRYYLNQWTASPERWLPPGVWDRRAADRVIAPGTPVVLGFDGSWSGDSTGIVGATLEDVPHIFAVEAWEKPEGREDWHVDVLDVEERLREACRQWDVVRIGCDPHRWQRSLTVLEEDGLPVIPWPSHSVPVMVTGCTQFYEAVIGGLLTQDGDPRLAKHMANAVVKIDARGPRIVKDQKDSPRKIDLAVCAVIALDLATKERTSVGELVVDFA